MKRERKSIPVYDLIYFKATTGGYNTLKSKFLLQTIKGYPQVFIFLINLVVIAFEFAFLSDS